MGSHDARGTAGNRQRTRRDIEFVARHADQDRQQHQPSKGLVEIGAGYELERQGANDGADGKSNQRTAQCGDVDCRPLSISGQEREHDAGEQHRARNEASIDQRKNGNHKQRKPYSDGRLQRRTDGHDCDSDGDARRFERWFDHRSRLAEVASPSSPEFRMGVIPIACSAKPIEGASSAPEPRR